MATIVLEVQSLLEDDAHDHGFTEGVIQELIDAGRGANRIAEMYYRKRAAQTLYLVNVSESSSTRGMEVVHARMIKLAEMYGKLADVEEADSGDGGGTISQDRFIRSWDIERA